MRKFFTALVVLLALGALTAVPAMAADGNADVQIDLVEEEALMTPAEDPAVPDLAEPGQGTFEEKLQACDASVHCPSPSCTCIDNCGIKCYC